MHRMYKKVIIGARKLVLCIEVVYCILINMECPGFTILLNVKQTSLCVCVPVQVHYSVYVYLSTSTL